MRKVLCLALGVVATLTAMVGCSYDDEAIWEKFDELEEEVEENRNDIAGHPKRGGGNKKIVSLYYEYRYTTLIGKFDATNRYAYSL